MSSLKFTINNTGQLTNYKSYEAFGDTKLDTLGVTRQGYIGKEKDVESSLGDHGVRKYDYETGRFNSIDPLWEKYLSWTPYQYCGNNPIWAKDWDGKIIMSKKDQEQYPKLATLVKDIIPNLSSNDDLVNAMALTAKVKPQKVRESLKFGNEPNMKIIPLSFLRGYSVNPKEINISKGEVNWLESDSRPEFDPSQDIFNTSMIILTLHEVVEALNLSSSKPEGGCSGSKFENILFGNSYNSVLSIKSDINNINSILKTQQKKEEVK